MRRSRSILHISGLTCALALGAPAISVTDGPSLLTEGTTARAQPASPPPGVAPGCALGGSANVFVEGRGMLRLGDVQGCPGLAYEIVPNVFINGQPAVRLLPKQECGGAAGSKNVLIDGAPAARKGDGC